MLFNCLTDDLSDTDACDVLLCQLESVCTSDLGTLSSSDALNLTDQLVDRPKRLSKADAEKFFARLERDKWIVVSI